MQNHLLASQAAKVMGIPSSEIARLGQIITPSIPAQGKGHRALYDFRNLIEMKIVLLLSIFNVPHKNIHFLLEKLRNSHFQWLDEEGRDGWIVLDTNGQWSAGTTLNDAVSAITSEIEALVSINLTPIKEYFRENFPTDGVWNYSEK